MIIIHGRQVLSLLEGREKDIVEIIEKAYQAHAEGKSFLPHSSFVRFPNHPKNRIIALPAYLGDSFEVAGVKWIASFPDNKQKGLDRASAVIILNSIETGHPLAIMESSIISARRTAASATLAAQTLHGERQPENLGLIGLGPINFEILRFMRRLLPSIHRLYLYDIDPDQRCLFQEKVHTQFHISEVFLCETPGALSRECKLISLATNAVEPYLGVLEGSNRDSTFLHISLRDLTPDFLASAVNIVDDVEHVCQANTSVHLLEQQRGNRNFIAGTLTHVLHQQIPARGQGDKPVVFSPFGLGILDLALAKSVYEWAMAKGSYTENATFFPEPWVKSSYASPAELHQDSQA